MSDSPITFSYTADKKAFSSALLSLGLIMGLEGTALLILLVFLVSLLWLKLLLLFTLVALLLSLLFGLLLPPLWTRHSLTDSTLHLHYGLRLRVQIPRSLITNALPVRERLTLFQPLQARYEAKGLRVVACFSEQGQVLLKLSQPLPLKIAWSTLLVDTLLINVDTRDTFLRELALPTTQPASTTHISVQAKERTSVTATAPILPDTKSTVPAIRVEHLSRSFETFTAVDDLDMIIQPGEIYGFLGSNGAGKTTTIKMLVGLLQPTQGQIWMNGKNIWTDPIAAKSAFGYVADRSILYERLSGREFLAFLAQLRSIPQNVAEERIAFLLELLELDRFADRLCGSYSFGMKRKLSLAGALLSQPGILLLDEPLNGLDPPSARRLKDLFLELSAGGTTILLSTHDLATAEAICHRVGILHKGRLLAEGSAAKLQKLAVAPDLESVFLNLTADQIQEVSV